MSTDREDIAKKSEKNYDEDWSVVFIKGHPALVGLHEDFMKMSATSRCHFCFAPFDGDGPLPGRGPSNRNRNNCEACDGWMVEHHPGGVRSDFPMISVDMRGSVALAESMDSGEYQRRFEDPFLVAATQALIDTDGFTAETRGDEVRGLYPIGFSGPKHVRKAVEGARHLLQDISPKTPEGTSIPFGIGVHMGDTMIGTQPRAGVFQRVAITGDGPNTCSRICDEAGPGEALISEIVCEKAGLPIDRLEGRRLTLEGKKEPISVYVITARSKIKPFPIRPS
jgi:class 3 adenylate cyclase